MQPQSIIPVICPQCGQAFRPPWKNQKYCSRECASKNSNIGRIIKGRPRIRVEATCTICGKKCLVPPYRALHFKACSQKCSTMIARLAAKTVSKLEFKMQDIMVKAGLSAIHQYKIGFYMVDFAFAQQKVVIECDGDYWHSLPNNMANDRRKNTYLTRQGWCVIHLPEHKINSVPGECLQLIQEALA